MALAETANLAVKLTLGGNFVSQLGKVNQSLGTFDKKASRAYRAGQQIGTGIKRGAALAAAGAGLLATQVIAGLDSLIELEQAQAQTEAVIKSTGGAAKVTAAQVRTLAEQYESLNATVGDEVIQSGENLLLTFTNIREKAFEPALQAALDMNTALGKGPDGLAGTVRIVGKALNDPTKGLAALGRVGITFSKEQTKRIQKLQKEGKLYEAQGVILKELEKRFGGSFIAQGDTTAGKVAKFTDSIEDLQRSLATALLPAIGNVADALSDFLKDPEVIKGAEELGQEIGKLFSKENIKNGIAALRDGAKFFMSIVGPIGEVVGAAVKAFTSLPPDIQKLLVGGFAVNKLTGGLVANIAGGIFGALKAMTVQAGVVNVSGGVVNGGGGGVPGAAGGAGKLGKALGVASAVTSVVGVVATQQEVSGQSTAQAAEIKAGLDSSIAGKSLPELKTALMGVEQGITDLRSNPLYTLVQGEALTTLQQMQTDLQAQIADKEVADATLETARETKKGLAFVSGKVSKLTQTTSSKGDKQKAATDKVKAAQVETKRETAKGAAFTALTTRTSTAAQTGALIGALWATRPIVTVSVTGNSVGKVQTHNNRYGKPQGSRDQDAWDSQRPR